jgi:hypothetical protein
MIVSGRHGFMPELLLLLSGAFWFVLFFLPVPVLAAFFEALLQLFFFFRCHVVKALVHAVFPVVMASPASARAAMSAPAEPAPSESSEKDFREYQEADGLDKGDDRTMEEGRHQPVPQVHGSKAEEQHKCGDPEYDLQRHKEFESFVHVFYFFNAFNSLVF